MGYKLNPFTGKLDVTDSPSGAFEAVEVSGDLTLGTGTPVTTVQAVTPTANRTISFPDQSGTVALVAGATGAIQYNEGGAQTGTADFAVDPDWNNASTTFTGLKLNVTDTASAADSKTVDIQVNGTSIFKILDSIPTYADDTAAGSGGLTAGDVYKTSTGSLQIKL